MNKRINIKLLNINSLTESGKFLYKIQLKTHYVFFEILASQVFQKIHRGLIHGFDIMSKVADSSQEVIILIVWAMPTLSKLLPIAILALIMGDLFFLKAILRAAFKKQLVLRSPGKAMYTTRSFYVIARSARQL